MKTVFVSMIRFARPRLTCAALLVSSFFMIFSAPVRCQEPQLIPQPRELQSKPQRFPIPTNLEIHLLAPASDEDRRAAVSLQHELQLTTGQEFPVLSSPQVPGSGPVILLGRLDQPAVRSLLSSLNLNASGINDEGYALDVEPNRVLVAGKDGPGLFYGVQTLRQLIVPTSQFRAEILGVRIRDWPAMRYRGVLIDLSRGPVPTFETLRDAVDTVAEFKMNQVYFHMQDSFRSLRQPLIGLLSDTVSQDEWRKLTAYAGKQYVDIIAEQESCGHLHKILRFEEYSGFGERDRGHVLAPAEDERSRFTDNLFAEMMPLFPSPFFHIGCDETWELGRGRSGDRVRAESGGKVYIENLKRVYSLARAHGKRVLFWGDIALTHPELLKELPKDLIVATWEYFPHEDYSKWLKPFQDAGLQVIVCPWVGNTNLIVPDVVNSGLNIQRFVRDGQKAGAVGMMNTSWNDDGETLLSMNWYGFVLGAACSWQQGECNVQDFNNRFDWAFFRNTDHRFTEVILGLAGTNRLILTAGSGSVYNPQYGGTGNSLFWLNPFESAGARDMKRILPVTPQVRAAAEKALTTIKQSRERARRHAEILKYWEFAALRIDALAYRYQAVADISRFYRALYTKTPKRPVSTEDYIELSDFSGIEGTDGRLQDMLEYSVVLRDQYRKLWLTENRADWLPNNSALWDRHVDFWVDQIYKFKRLRSDFYEGIPLPPPDSIGLIEVPTEGEK